MLKKGEETKNPTKTKKQQLLMNLAIVLSGITCTVLKEKFPEMAIWEMQDYITGGFVALFGLANIGFTAASTKKVGPTG